MQDVRQTLQVRRVEAFAGFSRRVYEYLIAIFILSLGTLPMAVLLLKTRDLGLRDRFDPAVLCDLKCLVCALLLACGASGGCLESREDSCNWLCVPHARLSRSGGFHVARGISRGVSACGHFLGIYRRRAALAPFASRRGSIPGNGIRLPQGPLPAPRVNPNPGRGPDLAIFTGTWTRGRRSRSRTGATGAYRSM